MKSIGIDIGKRRCAACLMGRDGTVLEETTYENTDAVAAMSARMVKAMHGECQAVCESTGNLWIKTCGAPGDRGIPTVLANPMKVRAIAEASVKTDKVDALTLAHLLRTNLIASCHMAERGTRGVRQLLRERSNLVKARTQIINRLHNLLDGHDLNLKELAHGIWREKALGSLDSKGLADSNDDYILRQYVRDIRHYNSELALLEKEIARQASASEDARILTGMTGIGCYTAMLLASKIDGIGRFATPNKLVSWAGMFPTVHQSGNTSYHEKMKDSNRRVKWVPDAVCKRGRTARRPYEGVLRQGQKDAPPQRRNIARGKQDGRDHLARTDRRDTVREQGREILYRKKLKRMDATR